MIGFGRRGDGGVLSVLRRDVAGNTLALVAAALIPLIAMIGSGIDMSRAYMAQNRLSQACDAGALAGRRLLASTLTADVTAEATKYVNFNFPPGMFQTASFTPTVSVPAAGTVQVAMNTRLPTTIMKFFGFTAIPLRATCSATQDFINTDIALVLDLSGSMNCAPGQPGNCLNVEQTNSKIGALRAAAKSLYETLEGGQNQLHNNNLRLRYAFVTYNSAVNVGRLLYAKNPDYLVQSWHYRTRTPNWFDATPIKPAFFGAPIKNEAECSNAYKYEVQAKFNRIQYNNIIGGFWNFPTPGKCQAISTPDLISSGYTYGDVTGIDVRPLLLTSDTNTYDSSRVIGQVFGGNDERPVTVPTVWNGCIEERSTNNVDINGGGSTTAPANAYDLDVRTIPYNDDTRWRPMWPEIEYDAAAEKADSYCPSESRRLQEYYSDKTGFTDYLNGLKATGSTYHDLGIIWGARFLSSQGIFKSANPVTNDQTDPDNPEKIRGFSVRKFMIFMTDGDMQPNSRIYSSYGIEQLEGRVMGTPSTDDNALTARHLQRFRMACNAAKAEGISVWVIAFSTSLTADMTNCASAPSQASGITTQAALIAKFKEIGSKIGSLRLSQ